MRTLEQQATELFGRLVAGGAALGWVAPPTYAEVCGLLAGRWDGGEQALATVYEGERLAGIAFWKRYERPTHRPHADVEKVAVDPGFQGRGIGRRLMTELIDAARAATIEILTLDVRADNQAAVALYESLGFRRYGRLEDFVAFGEQRWDKLFYALTITSPKSR